MSKLINPHGLSACWMAVAQAFRDEYDKVGDYSCTTVINPPRIHFLKEKYDDKIEIDVADEMFSILGSAVHAILERASDDTAITEQRIILPVLGKKIAFKPDRYEHADRTLKDFKITKVFAYKKQKQEGGKYEPQLNLYAWALRKMGFPVDRIVVEMLLKDWAKFELMKDPHRYPPAPAAVLDIEVWSDEDCEKYIEERVQLFIDCEGLEPHQLPKCTHAERWAKPDRFAVKNIQKNGKPSSRAMNGGANFATRAEAEDFAASKGGGKHIEFRQGESPRCEDYCDVKDFCSQYQDEINPAF